MSTLNTDFRQVAGRYFASTLSDLVTLFSISFSQTLFKGALLDVQDADALRKACLLATEGVPDAVWDDSAWGWVTDYQTMTRRFVTDTFGHLPAQDQAAFMQWLDNGLGRESPFEFPRKFWIDAMIWASRAGEFPERADALLQVITPEQLGFARQICTDVLQARADPAFHDAAAAMCKQPPDATDLFQMTKFHIIFPDDDADADAYEDYAPDPFLTLGAIRNGNILRRHLAPIVAKGNPFEWDALDRMVQTYVATDPGVQDYQQDDARQTEAYALCNLYRWPRDA